MTATPSGSPSDYGCKLCGATDRPLTGTMLNRRCSNSVACAERLRAKSRPVLAAAPKPTAPNRYGVRNANNTPAEALIALLQQQAHLETITGPLEFSDDLKLPLIAAQGRYVCFGKSGSGKSNVSAVMIENCLIEHIPVCALDSLGNLWGLRRAGVIDGLAIPIIGGAHGDRPLAVDEGTKLARIFADGHSMLIDSSELTREDQQTFASEFFKESMRVLRRPAHVVVEEGETICPAFTRSKSHFASQGAVSLFARQIRNYGVGWTFSTQRLPLLHPDVVDASNAFLAMQTTGDIAQRAIGREAKTRVGSTVATAILNELGQLAVGYAWLIPDPSLLETEVGAPVRFKFRQRWTFNSTAVPRFGAVCAAPPKAVPVDMKPFSTSEKK